MALPTRKDSHGSYTDQLIYFSARLAADPKTSGLAEQVEELVVSVDEANRELVEARRAEVRARALRDHRDQHGDTAVRRFSRELGVAEDARFVVERLFPRGVRYATAPRGRKQIERLEQLRTNTNELLGSERLAAHVEAEELGASLEQGRATLDGLIKELGAAVESWEARALEVARARDAFDFRRSDGIARLGAVIGELRALLGGSSAAAYAYTAPARRASGSDDEYGDEEPDEDFELEHSAAVAE